MDVSRIPRCASIRHGNTILFCQVLEAPRHLKEIRNLRQFGNEVTGRTLFVKLRHYKTLPSKCVSPGGQEILLPNSLIYLWSTWPQNLPLGSSEKLNLCCKTPLFLIHFSLSIFILRFRLSSNSPNPFFQDKVRGQKKYFWFTL